MQSQIELDDYGNPIQKEIELDDYGNPISFSAGIPVEIPVEETEEQGLLSKLWKAANTKMFSGLGNIVPRRPFGPLTSEGFERGSDLVGDIVEELPTPLNVGMALATGGTGILAKAGMPIAAKGLHRVGQALSGVMGIEGGMNVIGGAQDKDLIRGGLGAVQAAGGVLGMRARMPNIRTSPSTNIVDDIPLPTSPVESVPGNITVVTLNKKKASQEIVESIIARGYKIDQHTPFTSDGKIRFIKDNTPTGDIVPPGSAPLLNRGTGTPNPADALIDPVGSLNKINSAMTMASPAQRKNLYSEVADFSRTLLASTDLSAPGRQGLAFITRPEYWTSFGDMFRAWGSQRAYENVLESIAQHPNFSQIRKFPTGKTGKDGSSKFKETTLAEMAGLDLSDLNFKNEEIFRSKLAEMIPGVKRSNRAYVAYLNKLRADAFNRILNQAKAIGEDPENNQELLKQIGEFINDATGRGKFNIPKSMKTFNGKELELGPVAERLMSELFFAPKLMASRINMYNRVLNPMRIAKTDPMLRKEALRSMFGIVGLGGTMGGLLEAIGVASVNKDPRSSDFGKIKIGNTRIDPYGGFQQYFVAASRFASGDYVTTGGDQLDLTEPSYGGLDRSDVLSNFMTNKLAPVPSLINAWMNNSEFDGADFEFKQAVINRTVPIIIQDLVELYQEDPALLPLGLPAIFGIGIQTYGR